MTRACVGLVSLLLCGALELTAQTAVRPQQEISAGAAGMEGLNSESAKPRSGAWMTACPVQMQALHGTGRGLLMARDGKNEDMARPGQPSQTIHLILGDGNGKRIVQARVIARGFSPEGRMEHTVARAGHATMQSRTVVVRLHAEGKDTAAGDLVLPGFASVQSVDLLELRYEDGSSWSALTQTPCSVTPDPLMLVADR